MNFLNHLVTVIEHYGMLGIFVSMVIENCGIPLPTEGAFLVAQHLISNSQYSFWMMYWFIVSAHVVGAVIAYAIGRFAQKKLIKRLSRFKGFIDTQQKIRGWYDHHGSVIVLTTRLIGYLRPWSSLVAGLAEFPFWPFLFWSFIGTLLFVYPTMKVTSVLVLLWERYPSLQLLLSLALLFGFFWWLLLPFTRRRKKLPQT